MVIKLENLENTRDLGDIKTNNDKKIKNKRIIRSGRLFEASNNDIDTLVNNYDLKKVIDLRTTSEINKKKDPYIKDVDFFHIPIFEEKLEAVSKENIENKHDPLKEFFKIHDLSKSVNKSIKEFMTSLYPEMLESQTSISAYKNIFKVLDENKDGSILYHCSMGKDRVGLTTMLILTSLGFSKEDIIDDYLKTNEYYKNYIDSLENEAKNRNIDNELIEMIKYIEGVDIDYILEAYKYLDDNYGSVENYLEKALELDSNFIDRLKSNYLELGWKK